jgi:hypothetical protein
MSDALHPASHRSAAARSARASVLEKRNVPVSVRMAAKSASAIGRVIVSPASWIISRMRTPVAAAEVSLTVTSAKVGIRFLVVIDACARERALLQRACDVTDVLPVVHVDNEHGVDPVEQLPRSRFAINANLIVGIEKTQNLGRFGGVHHQHLLALGAQEVREPDLGARWRRRRD